MHPAYCPHCGGKIPVMVSDEDIRAAVDSREAKADPPTDNNLTWTRPFLFQGYTYWCNKDERHG